MLSDCACANVLIAMASVITHAPSLDPRAEMELSPSMPFRHRGERRLMIIDDKIVTPRDQFDVTYRLKPVGDTWMATSITVEDVSLTANLGSQLNDLLSRMSVDDVIALMRRKYGNASGAAQS